MSVLHLTAAEYRQLASKPTKPKRAAKTEAEKLIAREKRMAPRHRPDADLIVLNLPVAPSANSLWRNVPGVGRCATPGYRRWTKLASAEADLQTKASVRGPYTLTIELCELPPNSDASNRMKATEDLLAGFVTDDDRYNQRPVVEWARNTGAQVAKGRMRVTVRRAA